MTTVEEDLPGTVAATITGTMNASAEESGNKFKRFLSEVTRGCAESGALMIGHVKANVRSGDDMMSFNSTTDDGKVRVRTELSNYVKDYEMTINVIVYGLKENVISQVLMSKIPILGEPKVKIYSDTGCTDPKCSDPDCADQKHRIINIL
jgi:hypothetical protein